MIVREYELRQRRLNGRLARALMLLLAFGILTLWVERTWSVAVVQTGILAMTALCLAGAVRHGAELRAHAALAPLAGTVVVGCVQLAFGTTIYRWATEVAVLDWFVRLCVFFLAMQVFSLERIRDRFLRLSVAFGVAVAAIAIMQRFTTPDRVFWLFEIAPRAAGITMGPFVYHNQFASFMEMLVPVALFLALREGRLRWGYLTVSGVFIAGVITAVSRAGAALVVAETIAVFFLLRERLRPRTLAVAGGAALVVALLFVGAVGWGPLRDKFDRPDQLSERRLLYASTARMIADRPLTGFGLGTWPAAYPAYATFDDGRYDNQAHNDWLQWASEGGLPLALLMAGFAALIAPSAVRSVWGIGLLFVLAHCVVDYPFQQRPALGYAYFAIAGALAAWTPRDPPVR